MGEPKQKTNGPVTLKALSRIRLGVGKEIKDVEVGDRIEVTRAQAEQLIAGGAAQAVEEEKQ